MTFGTNDDSLRIDIEKNSKHGLTNGNTNGNLKPELKLPTWHPTLKFKEKDVPDPETTLELQEEIKGWHGYVEWERYPERKKRVKDYMKNFDFPGVSSWLL
jgi:hypothetical protein